MTVFQAAGAEGALEFPRAGEVPRDQLGSDIGHVLHARMKRLREAQQLAEATEAAAGETAASVSASTPAHGSTSQ